MGYKKPSLISRLTAKRLYRPLYYKYFDSWEHDPLPALPSEYKTFLDPAYRKPVFKLYRNKSIILLRSWKRYKRSLKRSDRCQIFSRTLPRKRFKRSSVPIGTDAAALKLAESV